MFNFHCKPTHRNVNCVTAGGDIKIRRKITVFAKRFVGSLVSRNRLLLPLLFTAFFLTANNTLAQESGGAGPDQKGGEKNSFKSKRKQRKEDRRLAKEKRKLEKQEQKAIKAHHKRIQTKDVQKRMKKNRRRDKRNARKYPT